MSILSHTSYVNSESCPRSVAFLDSEMHLQNLYVDVSLYHTEIETEVVN